MEILYVILGGLALFFGLRSQLSGNRELSKLKEENQSLNLRLTSEVDKYQRSEKELASTRKAITEKECELRKLHTEMATAKTRLEECKNRCTLSEKTLEKERANNEQLEKQLKAVSTEKSELKVKSEGLEEEASRVNERLEKTENNLEQKTNQYNKLNELFSKEKANNDALKEKLEVQKTEMEAMGKKFNVEFQNIANKILEEKTEKFTNTNKKNLESILNPLGENINKFKKQVEDAYNAESKERFSLGRQVEEMAKLNKVISDEARNLTNALKGEVKTQGRWGEMILEHILEKSGLRKGEEYFLEHQLLDDGGKPLRSDAENKKMRPDAVIKYPDNRSVIIDSKVSLNAFSRYLASNDKDEQEAELQSHINAMKNHITALSSKGYDDYSEALDFVLMFVPSEPAYIAALQKDPDLWNFAYSKRILLINPTNLITALKLIVDLWKREYQNQNAIKIAERGAKLYDKFVGFVKNLESVGSHINGAQGKYNEVYKQLSTGNDNLVSQATKLKNLGIKNKKDLPQHLEESALGRRNDG